MAWIRDYQAGVRWLPFWPLHSHFRRWGGPRRRTGSDHPCSGSAGPQQPQRRPTGARGRLQATGTHPEVADFQEIWTRWVESGVFSANEGNRHQGASCTYISSICAKIVFRATIRPHCNVLRRKKVYLACFLSNQCSLLARKEIWRILSITDLAKSDLNNPVQGPVTWSSLHNTKAGRGRGGRGGGGGGGGGRAIPSGDCALPIFLFSN